MVPAHRRAIGGLKDTVIDYDAGLGTDLSLTDTSPTCYGEHRKALRAFTDPIADRVDPSSDAHDFSWDRSAQAYSNLCEQLLR
jgi:glycogen synthase